MYNEENEIKDCFAYFGRTLYSAQVVEKAILNILLLNQITNITEQKYNELLVEKSELTFMELKREIISLGLLSTEFIENLEKFHIKREWLSHNYWWDRSIELNCKELRPKILKELKILNDEFEKLNNQLEEKLTNIIAKQPINTSL
jgi:hypothetical protein